MKIGIDLDGVLFDSDRIFEAYAELFDIENNGKGKQVESRYLEVAYKWEDALFKKFISQYLDSILDDSPIMFLAKAIIEKLRQDGHKLVVITNRGALDEKERQSTLNRLKKEGLKFDDIEFTKGSKSLLCKKHCIDIMIDNTAEVVEDVASNGTKCIYFRDNTKKVELANVYEVHNWAEVYRTINKISQK